MICPRKYRAMTTGESPPEALADMSQELASRLEAMLDACMINAAATEAASAVRIAKMEAASPVPPAMQPLMQRLKSIKPRFTCVFSCRLSWMREQLGSRWTKRTIAELFREKVSQRYLGGGWGECRVECGKPSSKMVFQFGIQTDAEVSMHLRGTAALAGLGEILGVERAVDRDQESTVMYLEDLQLAARFMRFDLEATKRELALTDDYDIPDLLGGDDDDDGYYPPFEGSPDDDNFGG